MPETKALVEGLFHAIDTKNTDQFVSYLTDDSIFTMGDSPSVSGKENIRTAVGQFFQSIKDISHTVNDTIVSNDDLVTPGSVTYTRHDDTTLTVNFCNVYKLENDKIKDYNVFIDLSQLYK